MTGRGEGTEVHGIHKVVWGASLPRQASHPALSSCIAFEDPGQSHWAQAAHTGLTISRSTRLRVPAAFQLARSSAWKVLRCPSTCSLQL